MKKDSGKGPSKEQEIFDESQEKTRRNFQKEHKEHKGKMSLI